MWVVFKRAVFSQLFIFVLIIVTGAPDAEARRRCFVKGKPAPDLVIITKGTEIKWTGKCNAVSPKIVGTVTIKNVGQASTPKIDSSIVSVWDEQNEQCQVEQSAASELKPGEKFKAEIKACRFIAGQKLNGKRKIRIKIDKHQKIEECNERNNTWPGAIEIELICTPGKNEENHKKTGAS